MKKMMMSVVIVNYNGRDYVGEAIESILASDYRELEVVVVENGSCDGSWRYLVNRYGKNSRVKLVKLRENKYFAGGSNAGAKAAGGKWLMFLNSDAVVDKVCVSRLIEFAVGRETIIQPKICWQDRREVIDNVGGRYNWWGGGQAVGRDETDEGQYDRPTRYDYVNGTAMLLPRELFWRLGGFDEWYRYFYEDVDLGLRASGVGVECWGVPQAMAYHRGSVSMSKHVSRREVKFHYQKNRLMTLAKHRGGWTLGWSWLTVLNGGVRQGLTAWTVTVQRWLEGLISNFLVRVCWKIRVVFEEKFV